MKKTFQAAVFTLFAASMAQAQDAAPTGYALLSDSMTSFSSQQGLDGWRYKFDRGDGSAVSDMTNFIIDHGYPDLGGIWCPTPNFGGINSAPEYSHCGLTSDWSHANSSVDCFTPGSGLLRPIREWSNPTQGPLWIRVTIDPATSSSGIRFDLSVDSQVVWSRTWIYGNLPPADEWFEIPGGSLIALRMDPLGSCGSDGAKQRMQVYSPDCNGDGSADFTQILQGQLVDSDQNGIPDVCEVDPCPGDVTNGGSVDATDLSVILAAWGTNGQGEFDADADNSGLVDGGDLALVLSGWGPCPQ
jgi:hypothetical protein